MTRRWRPGDSRWIRVADVGHVALWMRPFANGVEVYVYSDDGFGHTPNHASVWRAFCPRGSYMPYVLLDKPHRIYWYENSITPLDECEYGYLLDAEALPRRTRRHRRDGYRRRIWCRGELPRKIRRALGDE